MILFFLSAICKTIFIFGFVHLKNAVEFSRIFRTLYRILTIFKMRSFPCHGMVMPVLTFSRNKALQSLENV